MAEKTKEATGADRKTEQQKELYDSLMGTGKPVTYKSVDIERKGTTIIIPEGMAYEDARNWIERKEHAEEQMINFQTKMKAYPYDGAYALYRAIIDIFGFADLTATGPSNDNPPKMINIKLPTGQHVEIPWGRIQFPGLDDNCYVDTAFDSNTMEFVITGKIKRKFEKIMQKLSDRTRELLRTESIYKGQAIRIDLAFMEKNESPDHPEFMNVTNLKDENILHSDVVKAEYSSVLLRIEKTRECFENNIPLKHGCLLAGPYGTGKTLTAKWTAKKAVDNGWTFIYLENSAHLKNALRIAEMYTPAVVFSEDIDKAMEGGRSVQMNEILNTLDGIDTKDHPIITILTTNHVENINKAFLRAGRIDSLIHMGPLDEKTGLQFINQFTKTADGKSMLLKGDYTESAQSLAGIVPAFASEVISKAKMFSFYRNGTLGKIGPEDITNAAKSFKAHIELTSTKKVENPLEELGKTFKALFAEVNKESLDNLQSAINKVKETVDNM